MEGGNCRREGCVGTERKWRGDPNERIVRERKRRRREGRMEDIHRNGRMGVEGEGGEESSPQVKTLKAPNLAYIKGQPISFVPPFQIRSFIQTLMIAVNILSRPSACRQSSAMVC